MDWFSHLVTLPYKLTFATVPPPILLGGWAWFFVALFYIGITTAFASDLASMLGCVLEIPDEVTAITLVALGTSVPDTFTSRICAINDDTADNAVGNVTGSNSNVFLGLGISWTMAAGYWGLKNIDDDPNSVFWNRKIGEDTYRTLFYEDSPEGGFF